MALPSALSSSRPQRDRKRVSLSNTSASLPPYKSPLLTVEPFEQPPDYPDSAEEADEETDDQSILLPPPISPRRRKLLRSVSQPRPTGFYVNPATTQSDTFLDKILERSVAALELSNALLQSSTSTNSYLSAVLTSDSAISDHTLDTQARALTGRIRDNSGVHERWMDDLDVLARDVEALYDEDGPKANVRRLNVPVKRVSKELAGGSISQSLPSSPGLQRKVHRSSRELRRRDSSVAESGYLRLSSPELHRFQAPAPRAMTQYVSVGVGFGEALESTSGASSIFLPSTTGLRSSVHASEFGAPSSSTLSPPPSPGSSAYVSLVANSRSQRASRSSSRTPTHRQRSYSRFSNQLSSSQLLPCLMPSPIEELPSQSDSSASDSPHPFRTVESLRKILDEQPMPSDSPNLKGKRPESRSPSRTRTTPSFPPRSPPVEPVMSTSTTTTSISHLFTKGAHSTSTRAPSPPPQSSLKQRSPGLASLQTQTSSSTLSIKDLLRPRSAISSGPSSGRSTPRNVVFGPLPESYAGSRPGGAPSRFQERKEAKAKARSRSNPKLKGGQRSKTGEKQKDGENSWWMTWLTGGSALSMDPTRQEEHAEDRMARSWGRPGMGLVFEDWAV